MNIIKHTQEHQILGFAEKGDGNTICLIGDSMTERDHFTPASEYRVVSPTSVFAWLNYLLGQRLKPLNIDAAYYTGNALAGVSGNTSAQALARWDSCIGPHTPHWIWIRIGYNDVTGAVAAATTKDNITQMIRRARAIGAKVLLSSIVPGNGINTDAEASVWYDVNQWIREVCQISRNVFYVPQGQSYTDGAAAYPQPLAGYTDGVHQYSHTAYLLALEAYAVLNALIPPKIPPFTSNYGAAQSFGAGVWENPLMVGTAGVDGTGFTGDAATSTTISVTGGGAAVGSKVARTDINGAEWQQIAYTGDAGFTNMTADYVEIQSTSGVPITTFAVGDLIQLFVEFEMDSAPTNFGGAYVFIQFGAPNTSQYANQLRLEATVNDVGLNRQMQSGIMATMPMAIPAGGSTVMYPVIRIVPRAANASFTVRIGRVSIVRVLDIDPI